MFSKSVFKVALTACLTLIASSTALADIVQYEIVWDATWSAETHPNAFHERASFSGLVGATHTAEWTMWELVGLATPGIKQIAEIGSGDDLMIEIDAAIETGLAYEEVVRVSGLTSPSLRVNNFKANSTHPLLSLATMIAPSPDWFVGLSRVNLREDGQWVSQLKFDVVPYDAGTDSGVDFGSGDEVTVPPEPITRITGAPFFDAQSLGTLTINLLSTPGDFDGSGAIGVGDVDVLCYRLGETHPRFELSGDEQITLEDVRALITELVGTRPGDANLDGKVNFADFLVLSSNFGGGADWSGGDFDCNRRIEFADFLQLSDNFGFSDELTSSVPEPLGIQMMLFAVGLMTCRHYPLWHWKSAALRS